MKPPRGLSGREVVDALVRRLDYRVVHERGSHVVLETPVSVDSCLVFVQLREALLETDVFSNDYLLPGQPCRISLPT
jgi:hypothetical protein